MFSTVYGVSSPTPGMESNESFVIFREKVTIIGFTGKDGVVFWFVYEHLDQVYPFGQCPRWSTAEADAVCQSISDVRIGRDLTFGQLYANRTRVLKIAAEEGVAKKWHNNRAVLVGDAALKMTQVGGQGANMAIEACATLANELMRGIKASPSGKKMSDEALRRALDRYSEQRIGVSRAMLDRTHAGISAILRIPDSASRVVAEPPPLSHDVMLTKILMDWADAPVLEDVPLTAAGHLFKETINALRSTTKAEKNEENNAEEANRPEAI